MIRRVRMGAAVAVGLIATASCFSERPGPLQPIDGTGCVVPASAIGPGRAVVLVRGFVFLPDTLRVRAGTAVTWINCEDAAVEPHTSTAVDGEWDSGTIAPGAAWDRVFDESGEFDYRCTPHPHMRGVILVG